MIRVPGTDFIKYIEWAERCACNQVYPLSVAEGIQSGEIYVDDRQNPKTVLFWHYCGFAYICGLATGMVLEALDEHICRNSKRRMLLITDDDSIIRFFGKRGKEIGKRIEYGYAGNSGTVGCIRGIDIRKIDANILSVINGRIVPAFSWENSVFLENGFGYAAFDHERYCGVAFSAAVSSEEIDIGVEVDPDYRGRGIATELVRSMCSEIILQGKRPVWAHAEQNTGSMRTAARCGFIRKKVNSTICLKKAEGSLYQVRM
jgi:GNAT superfamily N-acetyltransferase